MNVLQPVIASAEAALSRSAIISSRGSITYGELIGQSERLSAAWRRKGLGPGDRVLVAMPIGIPLYVSIIALWRLGAVIVFPEPSLGMDGLRHAIGATRPKALLACGVFSALRYIWPALWKTLRLSPDDAGRGTGSLEPVAHEHPALISFTSGSTGRPKAIVRTHGLLARQSACVAELLRSGRDEIDLIAFPMFVLANLSLNGTSVLPDWRLRFPDSVGSEGLARLIAEHGVSRVLLPPSTCECLAQAPSLRLNAILTGGGPVYPDLLQRLSVKHQVGDIVSVYGSTEAEPIAHHKLSDIAERDWALMQTGGGLLAGRPISSIKLQILGDEIVVAGDHVNKGYLDSTGDATTKIARGGDIWHRTGDAGRIDETGRLWLLGRLDGQARGLFPFAVEAAARTWTSVSRAALISIQGQPVLAIEGDADDRPAWQKEADRLGNIRVVPVRAIPLDRRHRSKVDYPQLRQMLHAT